MTTNFTSVDVVAYDRLLLGDSLTNEQLIHLFECFTFMNTIFHKLLHLNNWSFLPYLQATRMNLDTLTRFIDARLDVNRVAFGLPQFQLKNEYLRVKETVPTKNRYAGFNTDNRLTGLELEEIVQLKEILNSFPKKEYSMCSQMLDQTFYQLHS